ncbi:hypothetical protein, partial [Ruminococcus bicirculans (ex Wegman et al. 2014)]|uniref:hypothetical protein n=1 Tax=Ruminococcus bicirculans (ex Wegman et al. 2014) TaxID=1160721 RepID=UPI002430163B
GQADGGQQAAEDYTKEKTGYGIKSGRWNSHPQNSTIEKRIMRLVAEAVGFICILAEHSIVKIKTLFR